MEVTDAPVSDDPVTKALVKGPTWAGNSLTFSFPTMATQFTGYSGGEPSSNFEALNATQQAAVRGILAQISTFTNLAFTEGTDTSSAVLRFGMTDDTPTAHAYYPSTSQLGGDVWFRNSGGLYDDPREGNYAWLTIEHEIGHTLGLGHPHEASPPMDINHDWMPHTVMSYRSSLGGQLETGYTNEDWGFAQTFMVEDIAALQFLYGPNFAHNNTDNIYRWSPVTGEMFIDGAGQGAPGENRIFLTVWDGGGTDTYDFSNYAEDPASPYTIIVDLRPGNGTRLPEAQRPIIAPSDSFGNILNARQFDHDPRSLIENAIGSAGRDLIFGNEAPNHIDGSAGYDEIYGYGGDDVLIGEKVYGGDGADTISSSQPRMEGHLLADFHGDAGNDRIYGGVLNDYAWGGEGDDYIEGGDFDDGLYGEAGNDILLGGEGNDILAGGDGHDRLEAGPGNNTLDGGGGEDVLIAGDGNDSLSGGAGDDILEGGAGDDTYYIDAEDLLIELAGQGTDSVHVSMSYSAPDSIEHITLAEYGGPIHATLIGNASDNIVIGGFGNDVLDGRAGVDEMRGGFGADIYYVDCLEDIVVEDDRETQGIDTIFSSASYVLGEYAVDNPPAENPLLSGRNSWLNAVERLVLTGTANLAATGNSYANTLSGNAGLNRLDGMAGNDTLFGGGAGDELIGGAGADVFWYANATDSFGASIDWLSDFQHGLDLIDLREVVTTSLDFQVAPDSNSTLVAIGTGTGLGMAIRVAGVATAADFLYALSTPPTVAEPGSAFGAPNSWLPLGNSGTEPWSVGDFNGDGKTDVLRYAEGLSGGDVYLSDGSRFNQSGSWTGAGNGNDGWVVGDYDGDGKDDVFRYVDGETGAGVFLSTGSAFAYAGSWTGAGRGSEGWHVGDFNGDGRDDIFRYVEGETGAGVFLSTGSGFAYAGSWTGAGSGDEGWRVGDFNGDGRDDIFRYMPGVSGAQVFLSTGSSFDYHGSWTGAGNGADGWHIGDFNGDGMDDMFRTGEAGAGAEVFLSNGNLFVGAGLWASADQGTSGWHRGDFTGDGSVDLMRTTASATEILV